MSYRWRSAEYLHRVAAINSGGIDVGSVEYLVYSVRRCISVPVTVFDEPRAETWLKVNVTHIVQTNAGSQ